VAKILLQFDINTADGVASLDKIKQALESVGVSGTELQKSMDTQERSLQKVLDKAEPLRVAMDRLTASQATLDAGVQNGDIIKERAAAAMDALWEKYNKGQEATTKMTSSLDAVKEKYTETTTATNGFSSAIESMTSKLTSMFSNPLVLAGAALAAVGKGLEAVGKAAADEELINARLSATWNANAGVAGISRERLDQLAQSLSDMSGVSRDTIKSAEALGLTFSQVTGPMFERMMKDALDMSAVTGRDLTSSLEQLGRALQNPAAGLATLTRSGVTFTQSVREQIKAMAESGDQMGAMTLILDQVEGKYKNAAVTVGGGAVGAWNKLTNATKELMESLGSPLLPAFSGAAEKTTTTVQQATVAIDTWKNALSAFFETAGSGAGVMSSLKAFFQSLGGGSDEQLRVAAPALDLKAQFDALTNAVKGLSSSGLSQFYKDVADDTSAAAQKQRDYVQSVKDLLATLDPTITAAKQYNDRITLLNKAVKDHTITTTEYNKALVETNKAYGEMLPAMQTLTGTDILKGFSDLGDEIRNVDENITQTLPKMATYPGTDVLVGITTFGDAIRNTQGIVNGFADGLGGKMAGVADTMDKAAGDISKEFGKAFSDGFMAVFKGGSFQDAWAAVTNGMASVFSRSLGNMLSATLTGKDSQGNDVGSGLTGILKAGGLEYTNPVSGQTSFNYAAAGGMLGSLVSSNAQQGGNKTEGAVGGAISGAASGFMVGGVVGAVVGGVVGGIMGYFGTATGAKTFGYNLYAGTGGSSTSISGVGPSADTQAQMTLQLADTVQTTSKSMRDLLYTMKQPMVSPTLGFSFTGKTADSDAMFKNILSNLLPKDIFAAYTPAITTGMQGIGVSDSRIAQEIAAVNSGDFTTAFAALQAYISAVVRLSDLQANLGKSFQTLSDELMRSDNANWLAGVKDTLDNIALLSGDIGSLTSEEQVARAGQIADLAETQYNNNLTYLKEILQAQQNVDASFKSMQQTWDEQKAVAAGPDAAAQYYLSNLTNAQEQLKSTTSPEQVTALIAQMQGWMQSLYAMNYQGVGFSGEGTQTWVEQFSKDTQTLADSMLKGFADNVIAQNKVLSDAVSAIQAALITETTANANLTAALDGTSDSAGGLGGSLDQASAAADGFAAVIGAAAAAAVAAIGELGAAASNASNRVQGWA
jgi:hypothetical protein